MYYRRHRRSFRRRHARKRVFGKKATRAIQAIAAKREETKWYINTQDISGLPASAGGTNSYAALFNIFDSVPRADSTGVSSRSEVLGQEADLRGFSVKWLMYYPAGDIIRLCKMRISLVESTVYAATSGQWVDLTTTGFPFEDEDGNTNATLQRFDMDRVKVLKSKKFTLAAAGKASLLHEGKIWVPKRKKVVAQAQEGGIFGDEMGQLKDKNYYVIVEWYDPAGLLTGTVSPYHCIVDVKTYWKDA